MSLWVREEFFYCDGCAESGCAGHDCKLTLQDTADTFSYYIDDELVLHSGLDQMQKLKDMIDSLDYLK